MRLADVVTDLRGADPRAKGAGQGSAEQASDMNVAPFGDVLADLGPASIPTMPSANGEDVSLVQDTVAAKSGENGTPMKVSLPQVAGAQKYVGSTCPTDVKSTESDTVDELISRLSRGASLAPSERPASNVTAKLTPVDGTKESSRTSSDKPKNAAAPDDIVAMLLAGPARTVTPGSAHASPSSTDTARTVARLTTSNVSHAPDASSVQEDSLEAKTGQKPLPDTASSVAERPPEVADISVSTHLAPAASSSLKSGSVGDPQTISSAPDQRSPDRLAVDARPDTASKPLSAVPISPEVAGASNNAAPAVSASAASAKISPAPKPSGGSKSPTDTAQKDRSESSNPVILQGSDAKASPVEVVSSKGEDTSARQRDSRPTEPTMARTSTTEGGIALDALHPASASVAVSKVAETVVELAEANSPAAVLSSPIAPARTLTLQLNQADLGPVAIRMHLTGRDLDLQLTVSDQGTLADLSRDRGALVSALSNHHYQVHSLVIQDGAGVPASGGNLVGSGDTGSGTRPDAQGTGDRNGSGRNDQQKTPRGDTRSDQTGPRRASDARRGNSLFV